MRLLVVVRVTYAYSSETMYESTLQVSLLVNDHSIIDGSRRISEQFTMKRVSKRVRTLTRNNCWTCNVCRAILYIRADGLRNWKQLVEKFNGPERPVCQRVAS